MSDKVVIVTGASRGIGAATARLAGERGYAVCVNYRRNQSAAESVVADIERSGGRAIAVAAEVVGEGIRVNAVRPGLIHTDIHASGGEPGRIDRLKGSIPMKRGGEPIEVARAILWLLSDEASYTTGAFIDVSGGR